MKRTLDNSIKILLGLLGIIIGWSLNALAWSGYLHAPFHSIALILGVGLFIASVLYLILFKRKQHISDFTHPRSIGKWLIGLNLNLVNPTKADFDDLDRIVSYEDLKVWMNCREFVPSV
jgi:hypothetical protein